VERFRRSRFHSVMEEPLASARVIRFQDQWGVQYRYPDDGLSYSFFVGTREQADVIVWWSNGCVESAMERRGGA
jgi:hypothetical protein